MGPISLNLMKKQSFLPFFILGMVSIISQVLLLRELMVTFYGNELFLGLALGCWLVWTALGSLIGKKFINRKAFFGNLIILFFFLPTSLILIRFLKTLFPLGVTINFFKAIGLTFVSLLPLGFSLGFFFTTAFSFSKTKKPAQLASRAYLVEILGLAVGGLLFNFFLIQFPPLLLTFLLSFLILLLTFFLHPKKALFTPLFLLLLLAFYKLPLLEQKTLAFQFPGQVLTKNSIYGRITVTQKANQYNFFESGTLMGISQKTEDTEYFIHPILLEHPNPKKILMIGGGLDGGLAEILKHQPEKVSYVELDPAMVKAVKNFLQPELSEVLENEKVNLVFADPRKFLQETHEKYDLVIINLPPPSTALINRLYTQQSFARTKAILKPGGVLAINLSLPTDYLSFEAQNLAASIYQTIKQEFNQILLLPEYTLLFLASNEPVLTTDHQLLSQRLAERQIKTDFISPAYLKNRLADDRIAMFTQALVKEGKINLDFHPIAYFYQTIFWQTLFSPRLATFFSYLPQIGISLFLLLVAALVFFLRWRRQSLPFFILALAGATTIIWEVILIFAFQIKFGYIYQKISLFLATILIGIGMGNYLATKFLDYKKHLKIVLFLIILFSLAMPLILEKANQEMIFFLLATVAGGLTGTIFPLITKGYLQKLKQVGIFYASDLIGSFFGAITASFIFIPIFGLKPTSYFLTIPFILVILLQKFGR